MKRFARFLALALLAGLVLPAAAKTIAVQGETGPATSSAQRRDSALSVFRFYSKNYKGHFYTIDPEERATLMCTNPNWKYEGIAYYAATEAVQGTVPLHRFYSKNYRGHFFTIDEEEMWMVRLTNPNWKYEGVAFYVYPSRSADPNRTATAIYRFWSKGYRHHFFTIDEDEMQDIRRSNPNWTYEGEAFYAYEWEP